MPRRLYGRGKTKIRNFMLAAASIALLSALALAAPCRAPKAS